ncbi:MAG: AmmeMemoRadiSam system protein B [Magnetococcales bacterium]|nr:AmmeMemoRadiSam system protein B [Magnetococcales bacterium]
MNGVVFVLVFLNLLLGLGMAEGAEERVHHATKAGTWYPDDPNLLASTLDQLLEQAPAMAQEAGKGIIRTRAILVPHAAYAYSGRVAAAAFKGLKGHFYKRVVVLAPAHTRSFSTLSVPGYSREETPLGEIRLDMEALRGLLEHPIVQSVADAHEQEHSVEMVLPLLQRTLAPGWKLLPILVGDLGDGAGYQQAAESVRSLLDEETLLVVSGDFTHYGEAFHYQPFPNDQQVAERLRQLDMKGVEWILSGNPAGWLTYKNKTGITACAFGPTMLLAHLIGKETTSTLIQYETSGSQSQDFSHSVSYVAARFQGYKPLREVGKKGPVVANGGLPEKEMHLLHQMARRALSLATSRGPTEVSSEAIAEEFAIPERFRKPAGVFVTLKKRDDLRGCIGFIEPIKPLYQAVVENAVNAALRDFRFPPVKKGELADLEVEVSILSPTEPVPSYTAFEVGRHGIVMKKGGRSAVFLPEVAVEQGWSREQTLEQLAMKAGLAPDAWRENAEFELFTSQKYTAPYQR